MKSSDLALS